MREKDFYKLERERKKKIMKERYFDRLKKQKDEILIELKKWKSEK